MEYITLKNGLCAIVDKNQHDSLTKRNWYLDKDGYAFSGSNLRMHRAVMSAPKGVEVDHINGNRLDNRILNLRICTRKENLQNKSISKSKTSSVYKGVYRHGNGWIAQIRKKHIGSFKLEKDAASAYNVKAKELFGKFAKLNTI